MSGYEVWRSRCPIQRTPICQPPWGLIFPTTRKDIYRESFNHAYAAHARESRQEAAARRIAWVAVKRSYVKAGENWVRRHP